MEALSVLSLFSGIGAFEMALENLKIKHTIANYCEIDTQAALSYSKLHNVPLSKNLGDITNVDVTKLPPNIDLITHGSPCQSFSLAGKQEGGDKGSNTKSSLLWYSLDIIAHCKPKYVIWENVKNVLSIKHRHNFEAYLDTLANLGYTNYYDVLNSKYFGVPQHRERVFCISILGEHTPFKFPIGNNATIPRLATILTSDYPEHLVQQGRKVLEICSTYQPTERREPTIAFIGSLSEKDRIGDAKTLSRNSPSGTRVYDSQGLACTQAAVGGGKGGTTGLYLHNGVIRRLTTLESWLIMGFTKQQHDMVKAIPISDRQLYKLSGNSIVVPVLEALLKCLSF